MCWNVQKTPAWNWTRTGTRHRAVGRMKVLLVVFPKFDAADEWFDEPGQDSLAFNEPARSDDA
jgi:hypothetical protein